MYSFVQKIMLYLKSGKFPRKRAEGRTRESSHSISLAPVYVYTPMYIYIYTNDETPRVTTHIIHSLVDPHCG